MAQQAIQFAHVSLTYNAGTDLAKTALDDLTASFLPGSVTMLVGQTGSGKSTILHLLDGLIRPTTGTIRMGQQQINSQSNDATLSRWRHQIGFVFQFPENQLFAQTVLDDIMFGPKNQGMSDQQAERRARRALHTVGLSQDFADRSPFALSGGQQRRVAMAGVLAMNYQLLLMDEPLSGLDPDGQQYLGQLVDHLRGYHKTVVMITHDMKMAALADTIMVLNQGHLTASLSPTTLFNRPNLLAANGLTTPPAVVMAAELRKQGVQLAPADSLSIDSLAAKIAPLLKEGSSHE